MSAVAAVLSTQAARSNRRGRPRPVCTICSDSMVAAEASAFLGDDDVVSYLWSCDNCGYGFVTKHAMESHSSN